MSRTLFNRIGLGCAAVALVGHVLQHHYHGMGSIETAALCTELANVAVFLFTFHIRSRAAESV